MPPPFFRSLAVCVLATSFGITPALAGKGNTSSISTGSSADFGVRSSKNNPGSHPTGIQLHLSVSLLSTTDPSSFADALKSALASATGIPKEQFNILSVQAGSSPE